MCRFKFSVSAILLVVLVALGTLYVQSTSLQKRRVKTLEHYMLYLGKGDYQSITALFTADGTAVSSSGKESKAAAFYQTLFTDTITSPHSEPIEVFTPTKSQNLYGMTFNYSWVTQSGESAQALFLDLVTFAKKSDKIQRLLVFSNTFQQDIMLMKATDASS